MDDDSFVKIDPKAPSDSFRYFYVCYAMSSQAFGNIILRQMKAKEDNGFNIASTTEFLFKLFNCTVIIISWHETNVVRYEQWKKFMNNLPDDMNFVHAKKKKRFDVIDGQGDGNQEKLGSLTSIKPPTDEKTD